MNQNSIPEAGKVYLALIGKKIRDARRSLQMKQSTLAKTVGLSKSEISRIENGKRETGIFKLIEISKALNVEMKYFFHELF